MYKGRKTYFYNGEEELYDAETQDFLIYDQEERETWEVIIVLPGVEEIPDDHRDRADEYRAAMIDQLSIQSDELLEKFLSEEEIPESPPFSFSSLFLIKRLSSFRFRCLSPTG